MFANQHADLCLDFLAPPYPHKPQRCSTSVGVTKDPRAKGSDLLSMQCLFILTANLCCLVACPDFRHLATFATAGATTTQFLGFLQAEVFVPG
jgi:hypothetical protein